MNFMAVTLCFCMNRPYQFYYFVPLVSFWFSMLYLVLLTPPRVTAMSCEANPLHYLYLAIKIIVFFSLIVILYMSEVSRPSQVAPSNSKIYHTLDPVSLKAGLKN